MSVSYTVQRLSHGDETTSTLCVARDVSLNGLVLNTSIDPYRKYLFYLDQSPFHLSLLSSRSFCLSILELPRVRASFAHFVFRDSRNVNVSRSPAARAGNKCLPVRHLYNS